MCLVFDVFVVCHLFFFFNQKTAYDVRISVCSSDVCSSDLPRAWWPIGAGIAAALALVVVLWPGLRPDVPIRSYAASDRIESVQLPDGSSVRLDLETAIDEIGRASCRERVCQYV